MTEAKWRKITDEQKLELAQLDQDELDVYWNMRAEGREHDKAISEAIKGRYN